MPGTASGSETVRNVRVTEAPRLWAASSSSGAMARKTAVMVHTAKTSPPTRWTRTTPETVPASPNR